MLASVFIKIEPFVCVAAARVLNRRRFELAIQSNSPPTLFIDKQINSLTTSSGTRSEKAPYIERYVVLICARGTPESFVLEYPYWPNRSHRRDATYAGEQETGGRRPRLLAPTICSPTSASEAHHAPNYRRKVFRDTVC